MAEFRLIGAILVLVLALMLEAEAGSSEEGKSTGLLQSLCPWNCVSAPKQTDSLGKDSSSNLPAGGLLKASNQVLHKPRSWVPKSRSIEMTRGHALKCLEPEYIAKEAQSLAKSVEFIDDQFIADYWSEHPGERNFMAISSLKAGEAIAKALIRGNSTEDSLEKHLSVPCFEYTRSFGKLKWEVYDASELLGKDYSKLISSLDDKTQAAFFRYEICKDTYILTGANKGSEQVASDLESPPAKYSEGPLIEMTRGRAFKCLEPEYISEKAQFLASDVEFIDDQLIADYWSDHPGEKNFEDIGSLGAKKAIAKAMIRGNLVGDSLEKHLSVPCQEYIRSFRKLKWEVYDASKLLGRDYSKLISSLDDKTQAAFFRYEICKDTDILTGAKGISDQVDSYLKSLPAN